MKEIEIFSGSSHLELAERVCQSLGVQPGSLKRKEYRNGCFELIFEGDVSEKIVFLIQTSLPDPDNLHKHIWELFQMVSYAKNYMAKEIIVVMPYVSYARSDKKYASKMCINAQLLVKTLEDSGMTGFIGIDFHSKNFEGFFSSKVYHLSVLDLFVKILKERNLESSFILPGDMGFLKNASILAEKLSIPFGEVEKERISDTEVRIKEIRGDFKDKDVIIFDDEISTGTTLKTLAQELEKGDVKSITFAVTHGLFVGDAIRNFQGIEKLKETIVTDTVPIKKEIGESLPLTIISIDNLLADKIKEICEKP